MQILPMRKKILVLLFMLCMISGFLPSIFSVTRDERGNEISEQKTEKKEGGGIPKADINLPENEQIPEKAITSGEETSAQLPGTPGKAVANKKPNNSKVYYEMGRQNLSTNDKTSAEYLKMAQESADDEFSRRARLAGMVQQARSGNTIIESEIESFPEEEKNGARLSLAEGWDFCYRSNPSQKKCSQSARKHYRYLVQTFPEEESGKQAAIKLAALCEKDKDYDLILSALVPAMKGLSLDTKYADRAWYFLGSAWENSLEHRDPYRAYLAYKKVSEIPDSQYQELAKRKMNNLKNFYIGN